ncbi:hypothetical protein CEUSTIGMA_g389.t1 [Chlamydomonas eustigma]|uniref:Chitin-binding type-2 domain-containing protein n=1 Tax=Chlamydomonas eustigma TaxID=1157962 RepID=A0A250WQ05_9CHLO|nr:hypothetical protein CEUSTIGMA_g389.t1 [Chlamydomonas eustigma]|eukprot:GAX72934.1 hypothetical protein CEUSTIGMA_g389.t1 [Chlamydomonas eustigma]
MQCPSGLLFNPNIQACDWPYNYVCTSASAFSTLPPSPSLQPTATSPFGPPPAQLSQPPPPLPQPPLQLPFPGQSRMSPAPLSSPPRTSPSPSPSPSPIVIHSSPSPSPPSPSPESRPIQSPPQTTMPTIQTLTLLPPSTSSPPSAPILIEVDSLAGSGTWYYVPTTYNGSTCGLAPTLSQFIAQNDYASAYPSCASYTAGPNQLTMTQLNTSNIVAIGQLYNPTQIARQTYCGKQVIISYNGNKVTPPDGGSFFVWDGCEACANPSGYDFSNIDLSLSGLGAVVGGTQSACQQGLVKGIAFQITSTQVHTFVP